LPDSVTLWPAFMIQKKLKFLCLFKNAAVSRSLSQYRGDRFADRNSGRPDHLQEMHLSITWPVQTEKVIYEDEQEKAYNHKTIHG
jgi:hypothetical protein